MTECAFCKGIMRRSVIIKYIGATVGRNQLFACPECRLVYWIKTDEIKRRKNHDE